MSSQKENHNGAINIEIRTFNLRLQSYIYDIAATIRETIVKQQKQRE